MTGTRFLLSLSRSIAGRGSRANARVQFSGSKGVENRGSDLRQKECAPDEQHQSKPRHRVHNPFAHLIPPLVAEKFILCSLFVLSRTKAVRTWVPGRGRFHPHVSCSLGGDGCPARFLPPGAKRHGEGGPRA